LKPSKILGVLPMFPPFLSPFLPSLLWYWGLNSGPCACYVDATISAMPLTQSVFLYSYFYGFTLVPQELILVFRMLYRFNFIFFHVAISYLYPFVLHPTFEYTFFCIMNSWMYQGTSLNFVFCFINLSSHIPVPHCFYKMV
jgi:hypothetical protein